MKVPLLLFAAILYPVLSSAQGVIKGRVTDEMRSPLPSVVIRLKKLPDTVVYKIELTNPSGNFSFNNLPRGHYVLRADLLGYQPVVKAGLVIGPADSVTDVGVLLLNLSSTLLNEVSVKAQAPLIEKQIDKTVVHVEQNIANTGTNALELLKKLPGVQVSSDGQITLNGKSGVNITIDGKTTWLSADDLANLLTNMPSSDIRQIEIMTNPSAKYDAEGTGGIINLIRKKNNKSGLNGSVTGTFGQGYFSWYKSGLVLNYKTNRYNLYLNNSYGCNKGLNVSNVTSDILNGSILTAEQVSTNTGITVNKAYNSSGGLDLYLSKNTTLTLSGSISDRRYSNHLTSVMTVADGHLNPTGSENFSALNADKPLNFTTGLQLLHKPDTAGRQWSADADYSGYLYEPGQHNTALNYDPSGSFTGQDKVFIDESRTLHIFGARVDYAQPLPGNGKLETGLKSSYVKAFNNSTYYHQLGIQSVVDPALGDNNISSENINAGYVNFNRQFQKLTVQAGLRTEQTVMKGQQLYTNASVDQHYFELFPTVFLNYKLNDHNTVNFQFGRRVDRPDYHELVPFRRPLSSTIYFEGNPNLKPDLNWHSELTWSWRNRFFVTAAYDIDRNYLRTLYYLDSNKTTITRRPTNVQGAHSWNVDFSYNHEPFKWLTTNTTITIYQNLFNGSADGFSLDDPGFATIDLVSNNSFRCSDNLSAEADFEYESRRQFVGSVFGAYATLNLALKQKLIHDQGSVTINANNVLNSESRGATDHYQNLNQYGYSYFYTRSVSITFSYRFGSGKLTKTQNRSGSAEEQNRAGN
ncbi:hypothetical protein BEL04_05380 [Mucilaginibacter sp. PPCGB 2223]|uniref:outer membrane beta-barrel protein n=1 Tax=Mucilaginibacter sp. PPCGB 2223 TaxID=1886027 RepID=UPI000826FD89|nr:outer membrane beta-barrel protein [Mucilaginibacter sp. PPCGB 2223]OCX53724.1 hypothetical protein BEL04_05380 [Mucilaginibacter sp. PPCGB 2223]